MARDCWGLRLGTGPNCDACCLQVEEAYIGAEELCERLQQDGESVLSMEALVAQALNFDLITHSPYLPLAGLFAVRFHPRMGQLPPALCSGFWKQSHCVCKSCLLTLLLPFLAPYLLVRATPACATAVQDATPVWCVF